MVISMNEPSSPLLRLSMVLLEERAYCISRKRPVICRLWRMRTGSLSPVRAVGYSIGLESLTKRYLYYVGTDEASARSLARRIAHGKLNPIHLSDVIADYIWEAENRAEPQETESE